MHSETEIQFAWKGEALALASAPGVFTPTGTTTLLVDAVRSTVQTPSAVLDLGCGTGIVGILLHRLGVAKALFASDLSASAVECTRVNCARYDCSVEARQGSLFAPWAGQAFDVVVDDISGVAQRLAEVSPWFRGIPCESGEDGTLLTVDVISHAGAHLRSGGRLFFPVLSLSNVGRLLSTAAAHFTTVTKVSRQEWRLPDDIAQQHGALLDRLTDEGSISLQRRFGMVLWYTEIYCASNT